MTTKVNTELNTIVVYESNVTPGYSIVHSHNNYELNYVKSGWGKRFVGDYFSSYEEGDLVLLGPNLPHSWEGNVDNGCNMAKNIVIQFSENFINDTLIRTPELKPALLLFKEAIQGIQFKGTKIKKIENELDKLLKEKGIKRMSHLLNIFDLLTKIKDREYLSSIGYIEQNSHSDFKRINKIYEYVFLNFQRKIKLKDISDLVYMTPGAFCRFFKANTNKTVFDVIKEVRIAYACKLLSSTDKTISEVSLDSGYTTLVHFYKQFNEIKGMSPKKYRKLKF